MVSRRNYFAITIVMCIIVFLFLSTGVITERWNDYEVNFHSKDIRKLPSSSGAYSAKGNTKDGILEQPGDFIVYIGSSKMEEAVEVWATYTKKRMESYTTLNKCVAAGWKVENRVPGMLVIDSDCISWEKVKDLEYLEEYLDSGSDVVFCSMPDVSVIKRSSRIQQLFGIKSVKEESVKVKGIHLYAGFLLGGEAVYMTSDKKEAKKRQDMELTLPWYELDAGTETYMKGLMKEDGTESEEAPTVIWKKNYRGSCLMAVNGSYMEDFGGIGLLSAMVAQMELYDLYPVVNAQSMVIADYPVLSQENEEQLMETYSRNMQGVGRDILWQGVMAAYRGSRMRLSCMMAPQLDYEDDLQPEQEQLHYYMKNLNKEDAEVGLSGISLSETPLKEKLEEDYDFIHDTLPDYYVSSFYAGNLDEEKVKAVLGEKSMSSVRTVISKDRKDNEIVGYLSEYVTEQKVLSDGFTHTYRDDFRIRCVETMLGYTNVLVDVTNAEYLEDEKDSWEKLSEDLVWNIQNYWKEFYGFQGTTASESDECIRKFLTLDYNQEREGKKISLKLSDTVGPVWFILRTHDEMIEQMEGGTFKKLEPDVFLLEIESQEAVMTMKSTALTYE